MKLTDLKVIYICPEHNEKYKARKHHMESLLSSIGFKDIVHYKSSTDSYPRCLVTATIDILTTYMDIPFLLLEDDVEFTGEYDFNLDDGVDAIYFGLSRSGGSSTKNIHDGPSLFEPYSKSQVRVLNMLSAHAILYITPCYKQAVIECLKPALTMNYYNDVLISRIQKNFMILANNSPAFFQSSKFNVPHLEYATKFKLIGDKAICPDRP